MKAREHLTAMPRPKPNRARRSRRAAFAEFPRRGILSKPGLRPWPGRRLSEESRPKNVGRSAEALAEGVRDAEFGRLVHRIDMCPIHCGNKVKVFFNGEEMFASVAEAIESATREILLETYILKDDATGHELAERLGQPIAV